MLHIILNLKANEVYVFYWYFEKLFQNALLLIREPAWRLSLFIPASIKNAENPTLNGKMNQNVRGIFQFFAPCDDRAVVEAT